MKTGIMRLELNACRPELYRAHQRIDRLEQSNQNQPTFL